MSAGSLSGGALLVACAGGRRANHPVECSSPGAGPQRTPTTRRHIPCALRASRCMQQHGRMPALHVKAVEGSAVQEATNGASGSGAAPSTSTSKVVGVLGGGQLGKMLAQAAARMGIPLRVLDPSPGCPASVVAEQSMGSFRDFDAVKAFAADIDVLTVEIEHIDTAAMQAVADAGVTVQPQPETLRVIQDKYLQKMHFTSHGVPVADFMEAADEDALDKAVQAFGFPLMLKSKRDAYDGKGNAVARTAADLDAAVVALGGFSRGLYAERWCTFAVELAVMVARSADGSVVSFPVVQTLHRDNICHVTEAPAAVPAPLAAQAAAVAERAVACLQGAGVFGVEMFLLQDGSLLLNEVAPRPHNSGHYTIEACSTSQYEQHLRAVLGLPLGDTQLVCGASIMLNLLGEADGPQGRAIAEQVMQRAYRVPGASVHWYGKEDVRKGRKVGHITITAPTNEEARRRLGAIEPLALEALRREAYVPAAGLASDVAGERAAGPAVGIIMGSDSDLATMSGAAAVLEEFGVAAEVTVVSAHRTPERMLEYARSAHKRGMKVIIAGAGGAAHLPGMVAALTPLPVVGVPVKPAGAHLDGLDALLSIVQMPKGVPVATVAIGNAANAGLLALRILAAADPALLQRMVEYQEAMREMVEDKAARLEAVGWRGYTKQ